MKTKEANCGMAWCPAVFCARPQRAVARPRAAPGPRDVVLQLVAAAAAAAAAAAGRLTAHSACADRWRGFVGMRDGDG